MISLMEIATPLTVSAGQWIFEPQSIHYTAESWHYFGITF